MARVLLVEDEITVLILAESVVQGLGHSTYSAGSVVQALALLDDPGEIDLLFTDIRLPEGDLGGFEVAEQARRKNPNLKVLYTTGDTITDAPELAAAIARLLPDE
jgi:CheY-like chemotaxis protein